MKYPKEVQDKLDVLNVYTENKLLYDFDCFHLYPQELAFPNGYYDGRFFELIGYNFDTKEKRNLGRHDGINCWGGKEITKLMIYADGSTFVAFKEKAIIEGIFQDQTII